MAKPLLYVLLALLAVACGGKRQADGQPAAAPDDAAGRGHQAAWAVAHTDHADTIALQRAILDVRATHDLYVLNGDDDAAQDFEQAFAGSLRRADPQVAEQIFDNQQP